MTSLWMIYWLEVLESLQIWAIRSWGQLYDKV